MQDVLRQAHVYIEDKRTKSAALGLGKLSISQDGSGLNGNERIRLGPRDDGRGQPPNDTQPNGYNNSTARPGSGSRTMDKGISRNFSSASTSRQNEASTINGSWRKSFDDGQPGNPQKGKVETKKSAVAENPLYKTRLCERFETEKKCPYGDKCTFAHGTVSMLMLAAVLYQPLIHIWSSTNYGIGQLLLVMRRQKETCLRIRCIKLECASALSASPFASMAPVVTLHTVPASLEYGH
jgi:hypothetical protein